MYTCIPDNATKPAVCAGLGMTEATDHGVSCRVPVLVVMRREGVERPGGRLKHKNMFTALCNIHL